MLDLVEEFRAFVKSSDGMLDEHEAHIFLEKKGEAATVRVRVVIFVLFVCPRSLLRLLVSTLLFLSIVLTTESRRSLPSVRR